MDVAFSDKTKTTLTSKGKTEVEKAALKLIREFLTRIIKQPLQNRIQ